MAVRAITADELSRLRRDNQASRLYLIIDLPEIVAQCQINQTFFSTDSVAQFAYDNVTGDLNDVEEGMTVWIGSAPGLYDLGQCRVRRAPDQGANTFYIGETSDIPFADNLYVTVVDEFGIWPRLPRALSDADFRMDYDITYSDQHSAWNPWPNMGPDAVVELRPDVAAGGFSPGVQVGFSANNSFAPDGTAINAPTWDAPGSADIDDPNSFTPTITYNTTGRFRVRATIPAANGKSSVGHRNVYVWSEAAPPITQFTLEGITASDAGWSFQVRMYAEATLSEVRDRAKVILFAKDFYGDEAVSLGPQSGRENIIVWGWIKGETIVYDAETSTVSFEVHGPQAWLEAARAEPVGLEDTDYSDNGGGAPDRWTEIENMTVLKGVFHALYWRSSASFCMDLTPFLVHLTFPQEIPTLVSTGINLWAQITEFMAPVLASAKADRYGNLYLFLDALLMPAAYRGFLSTVMTITTQDWQSPITLRRNPVSNASSLDLSGLIYSGGITDEVCVKAAGAATKRYGRPEVRDRLVLVSESQALELAANIMGQLNSEYPSVEITLAQNNRFWDIAPTGWARLTLAAEDTPRGVTLNDVRMAPRRIVYNYDANLSAFSVSVQFEVEPEAEIARVVTCPGAPEPAEEISLQEFSPSWPTTPTPPAALAMAHVLGAGLYLSENFSRSSPTWASRNTNLGNPTSTAARFRLFWDGARVWTTDLVGNNVHSLSDYSVDFWAAVLSGVDALALVQGIDATLSFVFFGIAARDIAHPGRLLLDVYAGSSSLTRFMALLRTEAGTLGSWTVGYNTTFPGIVVTGFGPLQSDYILPYYGNSGAAALTNRINDGVSTFTFPLATSDNGATATVLGANYFPRCRPRLNSGVVFAALNSFSTFTALYKSIDGGNNYLLHYTFPESVTSVFCDDSGQVVLAPNTTGTLIYYSRDGGRTFTPVTGPGSAVRRLIPAGGRGWYACGQTLLAYCPNIASPTWASRLGNLGAVSGDATPDIRDLVLLT